MSTRRRTRDSASSPTASSGVTALPVRNGPWRPLAVILGAISLAADIVTLISILPGSGSSHPDRPAAWAQIVGLIVLPVLIVCANLALAYAYVVAVNRTHVRPEPSDVKKLFHALVWTSWVVSFGSWVAWVLATQSGDLSSAARWLIGFGVSLAALPVAPLIARAGALAARTFKPGLPVTIKYAPREPRRQGIRGESPQKLQFGASFSGTVLPRRQTPEDFKIDYKHFKIDYIPPQDPEIGYTPPQHFRIDYTLSQDSELNYTPRQHFKIDYTPPQDVEIGYTRSQAPQGSQYNLTHEAGPSLREIAESLGALGAKDTLVKRNDPCPCGSGKKYKHCHGS